MSCRAYARRTVMRCAWLLALALLASGVGAAPAPAQVSPEQLLRVHLAPRGASSVRVLARDFLFEGQALVRTLQFSDRGCQGVFAWGGTGVRDLDLGLYSRGGLALAEDRGATPYGYARLCAEAGTSVYVSAQAYAGRGEVTLYAIESAPRELGRPPSQLPLAVAAGGRVSPPRAVGGEEGELAFEAPLLHDERQLAALGYSAAGPPSLLEVRAGFAEGALLLRAGVCFRVVAFVPGARGMMLEVVAGGLRREARSVDAELVRLALCTTNDGPHAVRVRTRALRSVALVRVFEQPLATVAEAVVYGEERALSLAETRIFARQRGLTLAHLGEAWLEGSTAVTWPIELRAGQCQLMAALPERGTEADLRLVDARGVVLAHNEGRRGPPVLFACARQTQRAQLLARGRGAAGPASLVLGVGGSR